MSDVGFFFKMNFKIPTEPYWPNSEPDDLYRSSNFTPLVSNSMIETDYPSDNDAMLKFIASLIRQIQALKAENAILRTHVKAPESRSNLSKIVCKFFQRGLCRNGRKCKFSHKAAKPQSSYQGFRNLKRCKFCGTVHLWGKSRCPNYIKERSKDSEILSRTFTKSKSSNYSDKGKSRRVQLNSTSSFSKLPCSANFILSYSIAPKSVLKTYSKFSLIVLF